MEMALYYPLRRLLHGGKKPDRPIGDFYTSPYLTHLFRGNDRHANRGNVAGPGSPALYHCGITAQAAGCFAAISFAV